MLNRFHPMCYMFVTYLIANGISFLCCVKKKYLQTYPLFLLFLSDFCFLTDNRKYWSFESRWPKFPDWGAEAVNASFLLQRRSPTRFNKSLNDGTASYLTWLMSITVSIWVPLFSAAGLFFKVPCSIVNDFSKNVVLSQHVFPLKTTWIKETNAQNITVSVF